MEGTESKKELPELKDPLEHISNLHPLLWEGAEPEQGKNSSSGKSGMQYPMCFL